MCGQFALLSSLDSIKAYLKAITSLNKWEPNASFYPGSPILAAISNKEMLKLGELRWGFIPHWAKEINSKTSFHNARSETIDTKISFKQSFQRRRCLIPANFFYEWDKNKTKYSVSVKDRKIFCFAGIWTKWKSGNEKIFSCSIITTKANRKISKIHHRMPVILPKTDERKWLKENSTEQLKKLLKPLPEDKVKINKIE